MRRGKRDLRAVAEQEIQSASPKKDGGSESDDENDRESSVMKSPDQVYHQMHVVVRISAIRRGQFQVRETHEDERMVETFVELFKNRNYGTGKNAITCAFIGMPPELSKRLHVYISTTPPFKVGGEELIGPNLTHLLTGDDTLSQSIQGYVFRFIDGMHRALALSHPEVIEVEPFPRVVLFIRKDWQPMSELECVILGSRFNSESNLFVQMSPKDRFHSLLSVIGSMHVLAESGKDVPGMEEYGRVKRRQREPGQKKQKLQNFIRDLLSGEELDPGTFSNYCFAHGWSLGVDKRQLLTYSAVVCRVHKYRQHSKILLDIARGINVSLKVLGTPAIWETENYAEQNMLLQSLREVSTAHKRKRGSDVRGNRRPRRKSVEDRAATALFKTEEGVGLAAAAIKETWRAVLKFLHTRGLSSEEALQLALPVTDNLNSTQTLTSYLIERFSSTSVADVLQLGKYPEHREQYVQTIFDYLEEKIELPKAAGNDTETDEDGDDNAEREKEAQDEEQQELLRKEKHKKEKEEAARKKVEEEAARKKSEEEAARKEAEEEAARKKAEEDVARKRAEEKAARKKAEEEAARKEAEEEAARKKAEEEAVRKEAEEEAARKKAVEDLARKRSEEETARKKAEEQEAARRKAEEETARKEAEEEAARKKAEEDVARKKADEEAGREESQESEHPRGSRHSAETHSRAIVRMPEYSRYTNELVDRDGFSVTCRSKPLSEDTDYIYVQYNIPKPRTGGYIEFNEALHTITSDDVIVVKEGTMVELGTNLTRTITLYHDEDDGAGLAVKDFKLQGELHDDSPEWLYVRQLEGTLEDCARYEEHNCQLMLRALGIRPPHRSFLALRKKALHTIRRGLYGAVSHIYREEFKFRGKHLETLALVDLLKIQMESKFRMLRAKLDHSGYVILPGIFQKARASADNDVNPVWSNHTSGNSSWNQYEQVLDSIHKLYAHVQSLLPSEEQVKTREMTDEQIRTWDCIRNTHRSVAAGITTDRRLTTSREAVTRDFEWPYRGQLSEDLVCGKATLETSVMLLASWLRLEFEDYDKYDDLRNRKEDMVALECLDTGGRFIGLVGKDGKRQVGHRDEFFPNTAPVNKLNGSLLKPSYFVIVPGAEGSPLWVGNGSHYYVNMTSEEQTKIAQTVSLKKLYIPPWSVFFGRADVVHAGAGGKDTGGLQCLRFHMYIHRADLCLGDAINSYIAHHFKIDRLSKSLPNIECLPRF